MSKVLSQMTLTSRLFAILCCVLLITLLGLPAALHADQAQYIYDDLGRLVQVIDGQGNVATYNDDAVGNLLSITRSTDAITRSREMRLLGWR